METHSPSRIAEAVLLRLDANIIAIVDRGKGEGAVAWYRIDRKGKQGDYVTEYGSHLLIFDDKNNVNLMHGHYRLPDANAAVLEAVTRAGYKL